MFFDGVSDDEDDDHSVNYVVSSDEEAEMDLKNFCHQRLRSLSVGSVVFNENDSILSVADDGSVVQKVCEQGE
jgi:hypothetical protein